MIHFFILLIAAVLGGCASVQPISRAVFQPSSTTDHRVDPSYKIGTPAEAFVGERMLRVQDYYVTTSEPGVTSTRLVPTDSFTINVPPFMSATVTPRDVVTVTGTTERNGRTYRLALLPGAVVQQLRFLVDSEGAFEGSALNTFGARMGWAYRPVPETVRLVPALSSPQVDSTKGFTNFELVYSGTSRDSFQLLYREYTQSDLARPAFSQTLVYDRSSATIRFRNLQIQVHEATNEKIRFTVISDGRASKL